MARKEAKLACCAITQALNEAYWNWTDAEKKVLLTNDIVEIAKIIKTRLETNGAIVKEMYAINHDKDVQMGWDDVAMKTVVEFKTHHIHCVVKFETDKGLTLPGIALAVGLESQFVEKAGQGKYGYDNLLAYLIHIKYPDKYQYVPDEVATICGRSYMGLFAEREQEWLKGRAKIQAEKSRADIDWLENEILDGKIFKNQVLLTDEYYAIYARNKRRCDDAFDTYGSRRAYRTMQSMADGNFKLSVFFIRGNAGSGKTRLAKQYVSTMIEQSMLIDGDKWRVCQTAASNPMDEYNGEEILMMDDVRGTAMSASDWLKLLDPYNISSASARYHNKVAACRVVIITSTKDPVEFFYYCKEMGGGDRSEAMDQFLRRILAMVTVLDADKFGQNNITLDVPKKVAPYITQVPNSSSQIEVSHKFVDGIAGDDDTLYRTPVDVIDDLVNITFANNGYSISDVDDEEYSDEVKEHEVPCEVLDE